MKQNFPLVMFLICLIACQHPGQKMETRQLNLDSLRQVLIKTDQEFSDLSKAKGRNVSFLSYMDENVTMLRPNSMPLLGKDTMQKRFAQFADTSYALTWTPLFADIAQSGELGYTYGKWLLVTTSNDSSEGTYATVWKVDRSGNWKFVLDMGNEGLKEKQQ